MTEGRGLQVEYADWVVLNGVGYYDVPLHSWRAVPVLRA